MPITRARAALRKLERLKKKQILGRFAGSLRPKQAKGSTPGDEVTDSAKQSLDTDGRARHALMGIVKDFGTDVLSNPSMLQNLCADEELDHDAPREANLIIDAAREGVAELLKRQERALGVGGAIGVATATLADQRLIDRNAARWVVTLFSQALGLNPAEVRTPEDTVLPDRGFSGQDRTVPPAVAPTPPAESLAPGRAPSGQLGQGVKEGALGGVFVPPVTGVGAGPPPEQKVRRRRFAWPLAVGGVLLIVGIGVGLYFGFWHASTPDYNKELSGQIDSTVTGCSPDKASDFISPRAQVGSQIDCVNAGSSSVDLVRFVLFTSRGGMSTAYDNYVQFKASTSINHGDCMNFTAFSNQCETTYHNGSSGPTVGRVVEFFSEHRPVMVFTVSAQNILVAMVGPESDNGNGLAQFFKSNNVVKGE